VREQGLGIREQGLGKAAPVRGTQSFVGVMVEVWKRPSLTGIELGWRLIPGLPILLLVLVASGILLGSLGMDIHLRALPLETLSIFKPAEALSDFAVTVKDGLLQVRPVMKLALPGLAVLWLLAAGFGRRLVFRRYDPRLNARAGTLIGLFALRYTILVLEVTLWLAACCWVAKVVILEPAAAQQDVNLVGFAGAVIVLTLVFFLLRAIGSWILLLAPLVAMERGLGVVESVRVALRVKGELRSKLIETNLVMGIVKIALIVLAMVFSACPLPFSNVETQTFLTCWWCGVGVWWVVMSDYFQVVRVAAYLRLWRSYEAKTAS